MTHPRPPPITPILIGPDKRSGQIREAFLRCRPAMQSCKLHRRDRGQSARQPWRNIIAHHVPFEGENTPGNSQRQNFSFGRNSSSSGAHPDSCCAPPMAQPTKGELAVDSIVVPEDAPPHDRLLPCINRGRPITGWRGWGVFFFCAFRGDPMRRIRFNPPRPERDP